ncbi:MAG: Rrf2 family transcriptional regulator [Comamonadaceae bacterium]
MRLTDYTDYTLRVLMFCALHPQRSVTIAELADSHAVSKNHLMKIVNDLARQGLLQTTRGRGGGLRLLKRAADIRIGDVVRASETDFRLVECFDASHNTCTLTAHCQLKQVFTTALRSYMAELDKVTLADITRQKPARLGNSSTAVNTPLQSKATRSTSSTRA